MGCPTYAEEKAGTISNLAHALANELDDWKGKAGYCEFAETRIPALEAVVLRVFERLLPLPVEDDLMELLWGALTGDQRALYGHTRPTAKPPLVATATIQHRLLTAFAALPPRHFVKIQTEVDTESGEAFLTACLFEKPPEDGWPSWGARFGHPPDAPTHNKPANNPFDPRVIVGLSSDPDDETFWERLAAMLEERASALGVKP